ncbi:uncharacterized protein F4807DRAFT_152028 [Annulohypoxylon truncatum]|uniref:uncharacterized protein n=1 Tax=Annulohypoxylon truncatum TaxID=327061 RepID=UPI0020083812|nr:uncharacterized protein F4807DRAFT_152028 [Annulohypoxylon truncatum]KAI1208428.1 hypothetical protein F4807DRAFT_152028 [Annulohypoxylon truncatum]
MESDEISDQFFTYDGRLESFKTAHPVARRPSNAKGKGSKTLTWPHEEPNPVQLAQAGLFFEPTPDAPDNTVCFLCIKAMAGWESSDSPLEEHLRLSPHCGWAIVAAIDAGLGDYAVDDPTGTEMTEARKATFAGRWPHDGKRGWKCKTKQLVDAGWKYTPTVDSDDMVSCTYCSLALDGWEPKDDPYEEHYRRSPGCQFFKLLTQYKKGLAKKKGRGKGARASQSSRLSAQSVASTAASDMASLLENPVDHEESVMTTTSVMTQGGTKRSRAKKGTAVKGKKTRAKKEAPVEVLEDEPEVEQELPPPPPPKPTRGRKRASDTLDDSVLTTAEAPATKKRATRARKRNTADASVIDQDHDLEMVDANPAPKSKAKGRKGKATTIRKGRNLSEASTISTTSQQEDAAHVMDDEELDRQLEADFDRPLSDDENIAADSDSDRKRAPVKSKGKKATTKKAATANHDEARNDHAMFDPEPPTIDEGVVDAELQAMATELEIDQDETLQVPKKGRKAGTRKASKQTTKKAKVQEPVEPEPEPGQQDAETANEDELAEGHDVSIVSNATLVRTSLSSSAAPKKRGRPSKKAAAASSDYAKPDELADGEARVDSSFRSERRVSAEKAPVVKKKSLEALASSSTSADKPLPLLPVPSEEPQAPTTPKAAISPAQAARQAVVSPSPSPQSSDAENEPPSSKPSNTANSNRVALAPVAATPVRSSPSKRNVLAGLQSTVPWTATDVEMVFEDLDKENTLGSAKYLKSGPDLTSPEKRMTVEEWIYHNAEEAQQKLKLECETMVSAFEREGTRALQALEGLVID